MKAEELADIKERAEKATSGPWYHTERDTQDIERYICSESTGDFVVSSGHYYDEDWSEIRYNDAEFIAHARQDVPKLVAEVERLRSVIWRISDYCDMSIEETQVFLNEVDDE